MISQQDKEKILDAVRIEEVIEQFVPLKRRGANYVACCPFHDEKTPSFSVNPAKGIFKCFGCGKAGDAVTFLMEYNHFTYVEALRWLAQKYGIPIVEKELTPEQLKEKDERDELYNINEFAQKYFHKNLLESEEGQNIGLSYFREREVTMETINTWGLGYCMQRSDDFSKHALKNGYSEELLIKSGLSLKSERTGQLYDRFHSRVTFPIYNIAGRVLGFSARILTSDKTKAKYVNSPETAIYTKGKVLFGLFFSKSEIAKQDLCYLVEGNVDAVMMYQNNVRNVVASSGTALTTDQVKLIKRFTKNVVILYDGDNAGIHATIRATDLFLQEGVHVKTLLFPDGDDPDSFARKHTQREFHDFLHDNAKNFILYRAEMAMQEARKDPIKKATLVKEIVHSISLIPDLIERNTYLQQCSIILEMSEQILAQELNTQRVNNALQTAKREQSTQTQTPTPVVVQPDPNDTQTQTPTPTKPNNPEEQQERAVIRALVSHANKTTMQTIIVDPEKNITDTMRVNAGQYIVNEIFSDEINFNNPLYAKVFGIYLDRALAEQAPPSQQEMIHHQDKEISTLVCDLLSTKYSISDMWRDRYNVNVPMPDSEASIDKEIKQSVLLLKFHKLNSKIDNMEKRLKDLDPDQQTEQLHKITLLRKVRAQIAKELHIVIF